MRILISIIFLILLLIFILKVHYTFSQEIDTQKTLGGSKSKYVKMTIHTAPKFTIQFSGSYNQGIYELSGNDNGDFNPQEFIVGKNFGVRHGFGGNVTAKIPLHEKGNIRLNVSAMYNKFSSRLNKIATGIAESGYVNFFVYSGSVGLENNFTPSYQFKTLVGASFMASVISGNAHIVTDEINKRLTIMPAFRLGACLYTGVEYMVNEKFGFNAGYEYVQANVWLKDSKPAPDENSIFLNDKRVTPRLPYSGWKQFAWGSFYGGVNFYFGITEKQYIIRNF